MTDSSDTRITYCAIQDRAKECAMKAMPEFPKLPAHPLYEYTPEDVAALWQSFIYELESLDAYDIAHESADWDWVIYHGRAMELCQAVPSSVLSDAESEYDDLGLEQDECSLYGLACTLAGLIVTREIAEAVEEVSLELLEMAETQMENL